MPLTRIAAALQLPEKGVAAVLKLLDEGATIPFIARYRKEATGGLDEVQIALIRDRLESLLAFDKRQEAILAALSERQQLSPELERALKQARTLVELEDLYLPFRPKKRSRAASARELGLEPLAMALLRQAQTPLDFPRLVPAGLTREAALDGARDILAEIISEDAALRQALRPLFLSQARLEVQVVKSKIDEAQKYRDYFEVSEPLGRVPSHRFLAIQRGEEEGFLRVQVRPDEAAALPLIERRFVRGRGFASDQVALAAQDAWKRLLLPSLEKEALSAAKERADAAAIAVFASNLREILLAPPLGAKSLIAIDPGQRSGAKIAVLGPQGQVLHTDTLYTLGSPAQQAAAASAFRQLCARFQVEFIALGNGTGGRETEAFLRALGLEAKIVSVDERGASIYSASDCARREFPEYDLTLRGAISIGRRLQDPLAEWVKLDPQSIGVGQYQHDVDQKALRKCLDEQVSSCVNSVGVELNQASLELLTHVSGIGEKLALAILDYRQKHGPFRRRQELLKVPRLGAKAFEQAAGFLRIADSDQFLDRSAVHPERYGLVTRIAQDLGCRPEELLASPELRARIAPQRYYGEGLGEATLADILRELAQPGRDPRPAFSVFAFDDSVHSIHDLRPGQKLPGRVSNVTAFGAFVDLGVHQDGLIHISKISRSFVRDPASVLKPGQELLVTVLEIDLPRRRIALSLVD
ncbi:MAG: hypothetical protein RL095_3138 [Verrucomicrobiota bacterium]|jgi:uncharacterized protein